MPPQRPESLVAVANSSRAVEPVPVRSAATPLLGSSVNEPGPALAKTVGVRAARAIEAVPLVAARLDRSNFTSLTHGQSISAQPIGSSMGSAVAPLRAAARHDPARLLFAPADMPSQGFTMNANPTRADLFATPALQQASSQLAGGKGSAAN